MGPTPPIPTASLCTGVGTPMDGPVELKGTALTLRILPMEPIITYNAKVEIFGFQLDLWGNPTDHWKPPVHDISCAGVYAVPLTMEDLDEAAEFFPGDEFADVWMETRDSEVLRQTYLSKLKAFNPKRDDGEVLSTWIAESIGTNVAKFDWMDEYTNWHESHR